MCWPSTLAGSPQHCAQPKKCCTCSTAQPVACVVGAPELRSLLFWAPARRAAWASWGRGPRPSGLGGWLHSWLCSWQLCKQLWEQLCKRPTKPWGGPWGQLGLHPTLQALRALFGASLLFAAPHGPIGAPLPPGPWAMSRWAKGWGQQVPCACMPKAHAPLGQWAPGTGPGGGAARGGACNGRRWQPTPIHGGFGRLETAPTPALELP